MTSRNTVGGNLLKMLFRSEFSRDSEFNVKRPPPPHKSFVGLLTMVCTVWLDTNTRAELLYALKYVSHDRYNMCTVLYGLVLAL